MPAGPKLFGQKNQPDQSHLAKICQTDQSHLAKYCQTEQSHLDKNARRANVIWPKILSFESYPDAKSHSIFISYFMLHPQWSPPAMECSMMEGNVENA